MKTTMAPVADRASTEGENAARNVLIGHYLPIRGTAAADYIQKLSLLLCVVSIMRNPLCFAIHACPYCLHVY